MTKDILFWAVWQLCWSLISSQCIILTIFTDFIFISSFYHFILLNIAVKLRHFMRFMKRFMRETFHHHQDINITILHLMRQSIQTLFTNICKRIKDYLPINHRVTNSQSKCWENSTKVIMSIYAHMPMDLIKRDFLSKSYQRITVVSQHGL